MIVIIKIVIIAIIAVVMIIIIINIRMFGSIIKVVDALAESKTIKTRNVKTNKTKPKTISIMQ